MVIYAVGLACAALFATVEPYLNSPAFVMGAVGIAWVFASVRTRARVADALYADLHEVYTLDKLSYYEYVQAHFKEICKLRPQIFIASVLFLVSGSAASIAFYHYPLVIGGEVQRSLRPWVFDARVYDAAAGPFYFVLVVLFAALVSLMLGASAWLLVRELVLVRSLTSLPVVPLANAVRARLKPLADFHVEVAVDWSLGASLFFVLFFPTPDLISVACIAALIIIAAAFLVAPQFYLTSVVRQAHEKTCRLALRDYGELISKDVAASQRFDYLADLTTATERPRFWVYSVEELVRWLAAQTVAIVALYQQIRSVR